MYGTQVKQVYTKYTIGNCTQSGQLAIVHKVYNWMIDQIFIDSKEEEDKYYSHST